MVFFNYATMQMAAKIVYYGPGLCGKTTNLHWVYAKTSPTSRGEMVSLETETDRTLFFDLLPIDVGVIGGFKTRLQLYTVPGQVFYNTTRKLVLKGVDGIVFVADSQRPMLDANVESLRNLRENLAEMGLDLDEIPLVVQLNKRDLPNIVDRETLWKAIDPEGRYEVVEASAVNGAGVFDTLKMISKITLRSLRKRMSGDEPAKTIRKSPALTQPRTIPPEAAAPEPAKPVMAAPASTPSSPPRAASTAPVPIGFTVPSSKAPPPTTGPAGADAVIPPPIHQNAPSFDEVEPDAEETAFSPEAYESAPAIEPDREAAAAAVGQAADFFGTATEQQPSEDEGEEKEMGEGEGEIKRVKVRSSIDIMAELEALRKRATAGVSSREKRGPARSGDTRKELMRNLSLEAAPGIIERTRRLRVTVAFEDEKNGIVQTQDQLVELEPESNVETLLVNLKIDLNR